MNSNQGNQASVAPDVQGGTAYVPCDRDQDVEEIRVLFVMPANHHIEDDEAKIEIIRAPTEQNSLSSIPIFQEKALRRWTKTKFPNLRRIVAIFNFDHHPVRDSHMDKIRDKNLVHVFDVLWETKNWCEFRYVTKVLGHDQDWSPGSIHMHIQNRFVKFYPKNHGKVLIDGLGLVGFGVGQYYISWKDKSESNVRIGQQRIVPDHEQPEDMMVVFDIPMKRGDGNWPEAKIVLDRSFVGHLPTPNTLGHLPTRDTLRLDNENSLERKIKEEYPNVVRIKAVFKFSEDAWDRARAREVDLACQYLWRLKDRCRFQLLPLLIVGPAPGVQRTISEDDHIPRYIVNTFRWATLDRNRQNSSQTVPGDLRLDDDGSKGFGAGAEYISWI